jgi:ABC-type glycerol-3-phosphate transport system substrate-binding protein
MKKLLTLVLTLTLSAVLAACGGGDNPNVDSPAAGDETPATGQTATTP